MRIACPAKINNFLAVGPPDATGFHPIRSIFRAVSLCDTLTIEAAEQTAVTFNIEGTPHENTLTKTLRLLNELVEVPHVHIHVEKVIPQQAGLGGGSTDAAGLIRGLNLMFPETWPQHFLLEVAAAVGKDVPFLLKSVCARVSGYGEVVEPIESGPPVPLLIVKPRIGSDTACSYRTLDEKQFAWREWPGDDWTCYNDFERVADCASLELIELLEFSGAKTFGMSGSGSAVFGVFESHADAAKASDKLSPNDIEGSWIVETISSEEASQWIL